MERIFPIALKAFQQKSQQCTFLFFVASFLPIQCRSKGNISGGGTRAPEARVARGVWGHAPPENFEI